MEIECPSCATANKIEFGENILCSKCKESFSGHYYQKIKLPLVSSVSALLIGAFGHNYIEEKVFSEARYPIEAEFEIIDSCTNASSLPMSSSYKAQKTKVCICALEKTAEEISFEDIDKSESEFLTHFTNNISSCN